MTNLINNNATAMVNESTMEEVREIPLPTQTETYMPVSHESVINYVSTELAEQLPQFKLQKNVYGVSNNGQYLFGMVTFSNGDDYMGPSIAYRNSYNKDISLGFAFGSQVFVCANGMFTGDIVVARKHTLNVWDSVRETVEASLTRVNASYEVMQNDVAEMRKIQLNDIEAYQALGELRGNDILASRVFEKSLKEWHTPSYNEHKDGSALQLYNACTEGLKLETYPARAMTQRIALHDKFTSMLNIQTGLPQNAKELSSI
jgi:hypothetical protein